MPRWEVVRITTIRRRVVVEAKSEGEALTVAASMDGCDIETGDERVTVSRVRDTAPGLRARGE
jgi:hypothetical protein